MSIKHLACAIIERAAEDVRFLKRNGSLRDTGQMVLDCADITGKGSSSEVAIRDALKFFNDGRLELLCDLINSPSIHADRIRSHVLGPSFTPHRKVQRSAI